MPLQLEVLRQQRGKHVRPGAQLRRVELAWEHDEAIASEGLDKGCDLPRAVPNHRFSLKIRVCNLGVVVCFDKSTCLRGECGDERSLVIVRAGKPSRRKVSTKDAICPALYRTMASP